MQLYGKLVEKERAKCVKNIHFPIPSLTLRIILKIMFDLWQKEGISLSAT